jgi:hypothetical protein
MHKKQKQKPLKYKYKIKSEKKPPTTYEQRKQS